MSERTFDVAPEAGFSLSASEAVAVLTLDRSDRKNALGRAFWDELRRLLVLLEQDERVRVLVLHGNGTCFSAGGDIEGFGELAGAADRRAYGQQSLGALRALEVFAKPTIAAVHGYAYGGGAEMTMVCDLVVADETARFAMPEVGVGLMPGLGVVRGAAHVPLHALKQLVLTGEPIDARTAQAIGLVNVVTAPGSHLDEARRIADVIARRAPLALAVAKRILNRGSDEGYDHSLEAVTMLQGTDDQTEGVAAFLEKRAPKFLGR